MKPKSIVEVLMSTHDWMAIRSKNYNAAIIAEDEESRIIELLRYTPAKEMMRLLDLYVPRDYWHTFYDKIVLTIGPKTNEGST